MEKSVGLVQTKFLKVNEELALESGAVLSEFEIAYETYGTLNSDKNNVIFIMHALTGDAHAAGYHSASDKKPGWWDILIGPNKAFDTNKNFVVCSNILGGCKGTTGPASINPKTNQPYGISFPVFTIEDTIKVQKKLIDFLGIKSFTIVGGSMGGMQALQWSISFPEMVKSVILIASTSRLSPQAIAFNAVARNAIISDPFWNNGNYYNQEKKPEKGLSIARMIGHITYLCEESMYHKFGRKLHDKEKFDFDFNIDFQVESYLKHQGEVFVDRFDANSYLYISKAVDYFDLTNKYGSLTNAFKDVNARFLVISFSSDWLFPTSHSKEIVNALMQLNKNVSFCEIQSDCGHDAFLLEHEIQSKIITSFLNEG